ncbi:hypothetical protein CMI37_09205 [Candidatus Pacearchaeota archaeon]|nr:hypothetical protein [Candidatus Pacearchaeota archaeon]
MPGGSTNGGYGGTPPGTPPGTFAGTGRTRMPNGAIAKPIQEVTKDVSYVASGANSNQIISISQTDDPAAVKTAIPTAIEVVNTGIVPIIVLSEYEGYSDEDTDVGRHTLQTMLMPGETMTPPTRGIIPTANQLHALDGTVVAYTTNLGDGTAFGTLKSDSLANVDTNDLSNTTTPTTIGLDSAASVNFFRVNDIIRVSDDIMRVLGTYSDDPTGSSLADIQIRVERGLFGSAPESVAGTPDIFFHCYNEYYDYDRALQGNSQLNMLDGMGRYKSSNFFGYGRKNGEAEDETFGLVPGSVCFRFYSSAYMDIPMGGTGVAGGTGGSNIPITSSTDSKLTAGQEYSLNLTCDDSSATTISFTVDSDNTTFGGVSGIINKLNEAILTATRTVGNALFGYSCTVSIVGGVLRFTSNSHLSPHDGTNGSKILIEDGAGGTNVLTGAAGIFPDINNSIAPVKPIISPVSIYDPITYAKTPNMAGMCYDNGFGSLIYGGASVGRINYESGAFDMTISSLPNSEFEISLAHDTPFAGKLDTAKEDTSTITAIHANVINNNITGKVNVKVF